MAREKVEHGLIVGDSAHSLGEKCSSTSSEKEFSSPHPLGTPASHQGWWKLFLVIASLWLGTMLVAIDNTILGTAVPKISTQFDAIDDVGWYGSAYLLTLTATQPTFGKVYKFFNPKWVYLSCIVIFEVGSTLCASSPNSRAFIVGRAVAGLGAAGLFQGALTIIGLTVPLPKRPLCLGIVVSAFGIALAFGPPLGGAFTDHLSWRWCFWVYTNLPIGGPVIALIIIFLKLDHVPGEDRQLPIRIKLQSLDFIGGACLFGTCTCMLLAVQWGGIKYAWDSSRIIGLFVGLGLLLTLFILLQWRSGDNATIPFRFLRQRSVIMGSLFMCASQGTSMVLAYYLPFFFQAVQGASATKSGLRYLSLVVPQIVALILSGAAVTATGHYVSFMIVGQCFAVIGLGLLTRLVPGTKTAEWASYLAISGFGLGIAVQLPYTALQVVLSDVDLPTGNAIMTFFSQLGGTLSVGIAQSIFINTLTKRIRQSTIDISPEAVLTAGATNLQALHLSPESLRLVQLAFSFGVLNTIIYALVVSCIAIPFAICMEWKNVAFVATEMAQANSDKEKGMISNDSEKGASQTTGTREEGCETT